MAHYSKISHKPTHHTNRNIIKRLRKIKIDSSQSPPPFTPDLVSNTIKNLKNSKAEGPDHISNIHLKHLGPIAITALTNIYNHAWLHNIFPPLWKHALIIPILKPKKSPKDVASYRPISLLSTISKVFEKLILTKIRNYIPLSDTQHGFRQNHSTTTLLTDLSQRISTGFNQNPPPSRTILTAIDINKAFDTVPRHILINKILDTPISPNDKKIIANFLSNRTGQVIQSKHSSKTYRLYNGVPQGAILSPTLFNLFMHDLPSPNSPQVKVSSYADDLTITSQNPNVQLATTTLQQYLTQLESWLTNNRMSASPQKSSITLLTPHRKESNYHPQVFLHNSILPLNKTPTILGITFDTHMTFTPHINNITTSANRKISALKALTGVKFGQHKETLKIVHKQFIESTLNYAYPVWGPIISTSNWTKLEKVQNGALRTITGCLRTTPIPHLQSETKILPIKDHLDIIGTQFYSKTLNPDHPLHLALRPIPTPRTKKNTPALYFSHIYNTIPPPPPNLPIIKHIHTQLTSRSLAQRPQNNILNALPPEINREEQSLDRQSRVCLSRLRCGHHPSLQKYKYRFHQSPTSNCSRCHLPVPEDVYHLLLACPSLAAARLYSNISSLEDLWSRPVAVASFLKAARFL
jgi:hypothetical protein